MAAKKHSPKRAPAKNRPSRRSGPPGERAPGALKRTPHQALDDQLAAMIQSLKIATSAIITSVQALKAQNADHDEDIALLLQRVASDRIHAEIERIEGMRLNLSSGWESQR